MSASLPGSRELPASQYDLSTYWGRVQQSAQIADPRTLFVSSTQLQQAKDLLSAYKTHQVPHMTPQLWHAKKIIDSTLHPDTGQPVFLPFRMSCFVLSNLVVTAGMLTPNLKTRGTLFWQITNQSLNVAINSANANKSSPMSMTDLMRNYAFAVTASCSVALGLNNLVPRLKSLTPQTRLILGRLVPFAAVASAGALNVFLMRSDEIRKGIDVYPSLPPQPQSHSESKPQPDTLAKETPSSDPSTSTSPSTPSTTQPSSLGKSPKAATLAVSETALSRVLNATPIMVLPPLILARLQNTPLLRTRPHLTLPINLGLILTTSIFALPLALGAFPQRQAVDAGSLEEEFHGRGGWGGKVEFNRGL